MMRFVNRAAVQTARKAAWLLLGWARHGHSLGVRERARKAQTGRRCAALLALGLGLNGLGLGLCVPSPVKTADPHACCPRSGDHHAGMPATEDTLTAPSASCCASYVAPGFTARIDDRDSFRHALVAAAATDVTTEDVIDTSVIAAAAASLRSSSPPRTPVLRI